MCIGFSRFSLSSMRPIGQETLRDRKVEKPSDSAYVSIRINFIYNKYTIYTLTPGNHPVQNCFKTTTKRGAPVHASSCRNSPNHIHPRPQPSACPSWPATSSPPGLRVTTPPAPHWPPDPGKGGFHQN